MPSCAKTSGATARGRAVGAVDEHAQRRAPRSPCRRRRRPRSRSARRRRRAARDSPTPAPVGRVALVAHQRLDAVLVGVVELEAVGAEELDAVVGERVVRGRDDGAEARPPARARARRRRASAARRRAARGRRRTRCRRTARPRACGPERRVSRPTRTTRAAPPRARARSSADARPSASASSGLSDVAVGDAADAVRAEQPAPRRLLALRELRAAPSALEAGLLALDLARVARQEARLA